MWIDRTEGYTEPKKRKGDPALRHRLEPWVRVFFKKTSLGFPGGAVVKNPPALNTTKESLGAATKTQRSQT